LEGKKMSLLAFQIGSIVVMLGLVWLITRGLDVPTRNVDKERRNVDFYRLYNEMDDKTETMFDRRGEK
jgi:hypothetical protein